MNHRPPKLSPRRSTLSYLPMVGKDGFEPSPSGVITPGALL